MKYKVQVGSHVTRYTQRTITVYAKNEDKAREKAIDKYIELEYKLNSVDAGEPQVNSILIGMGK